MAEQPHPVDVFVGARVRLARTMNGLSQQTLAKELGLTFQQIQKYERGANRISASRLYELSGILNVEIRYFFDGYETEHGGENSSLASTTKVDTSRFFRREVLEFVRVFDQIEEANIRKNLYDLARSLASRKTS